MARKRPIDRDTYSTERPSPLELVARIVGTSSYRVPLEGKGTKQAMSTSDITAAVGYMEDALERRVVMVTATRAGSEEIARMASLAYRRVVRVLRRQPGQPLDLRNGADRWRLRLVVYDAALHMVWPERRRPMNELAKGAKMRSQNYRTVYHCASSALQEVLNNGTESFRAALWGRN